MAVVYSSKLPFKKELAVKYGMTEGGIEEIIRAQFVFLKTVMGNLDARPIRLRYIGLFYIGKGSVHFRETIKACGKAKQLSREQYGNQTSP